ncbi:class F sortase [Nocardia otitidiscaviarum]|nr:class F sortase [Nocardia otitidiscaviarum]MCP9621149.1 class F sortase [Nocardia otitidiscaviarum]
MSRISKARRGAVWSAVSWTLLAVALLMIAAQGGPSGRSTVESAREATPMPAALPPPVAEGFEPDRIVVPRLGIDADVTPAGTIVAYDPFLGRQVDSFGVPADMRSTTWWSEGPEPGSQGLAIILGHSQIGGGYGVFNDIGSLRPGDRVEVAGSASSAGFLVREVISGVSKRDPHRLSSVLSDHANTAGIALVTCGGSFDPDRRVSEDNVVVIAELMAPARRGRPAGN